MRLTPKIAGAAVAVLALGGAGVVTAAASSAGVRAPAHVRASQSEPTSPDADAVQQGDQTGQDNTAAGAARAVRSHSVRAENPGEAAGTENGGASDGPGGHADPAGNVQHEFDGAE